MRTITIPFYAVNEMTVFNFLIKKKDLCNHEHMMFHDHLDLRYSGYNVYIALFQAPNSMICYNDGIILFHIPCLSIFLIRKHRHVSGPFSRTMTIRNQVGHLSRADIQHLQPEVRYVRLR